MEEYHGSFSLIHFSDYTERRIDRDGERVHVNELLEPDIDIDPNQPTDRQRIFQGFATNHELQSQNLAVTFLAGIIDSHSDEVFGRNTVDFHILSASLGITGLRAVGYLLNEDRIHHTAATRDAADPIAWWEVSPVPLDIPRKAGLPPQHISGGFFTRWPTNHDLHKLITDSLTKPE